MYGKSLVPHSLFFQIMFVELNTETTTSKEKNGLIRSLSTLKNSAPMLRINQRFM